MKNKIIGRQSKNPYSGFLQKYYLPGVNIGSKNMEFISMLILVLLIVSITYYFSFEDALTMLYQYSESGRILIRGSVMTDFNELTRHVFRFFWVYAALCLVDVIGNYRYFYVTRTIYVMKRMKNQGNLHRRCLFLPAVALVTGFVMLMITYFVFIQVYLHCTPAECLPEWTGINIWRAFL